MHILPGVLWISSPVALCDTGLVGACHSTHTCLRPIQRHNPKNNQYERLAPWISSSHVCISKQHSALVILTHSLSPPSYDMLGSTLCRREGF